MSQRYLIVLILWSIHSTTGIQFPTINNVALVPRFATDFVTLYNASCQQCLCEAYSNASAAVNCFFNNNTCQIFPYFPSRFRLVPTSQARLYFTGGALPSPSQCCMPNTTLLIQKLQSASIQSIDLPSVRCLAIDDHGFLATVQDGAEDLSRFSPQNLTLIDTTLFSGSLLTTMAYHQGAYFLSTRSNTILIVNSTTRSWINTIAVTGADRLRDMMFLKDGQTMVVASTGSQRLFFFNRSNSSPRDYTSTHSLATSFSKPHGLWYDNDTFFFFFFFVFARLTTKEVLTEHTRERKRRERKRKEKKERR